MSQLSQDRERFDDKGRKGDKPEPGRPRHGDIGYVSLVVPDVERAASFFSSVLGWRYAPGGAPEGRQVEGLSLSHGLWGGSPRSTLILCYAVNDLEAAVEGILAAGGAAEQAREEHYGRISDCIDTEGARFSVYEPPDGVSTGSREDEAGRSENGGLAYVTMEVVDSAGARSFYGSALGWRFTPGSTEEGWHIEDVVPMVGMSGGHDVATTVPMYQVDDIASAVERVRSAGGSAQEPEQQPYGVTSVCRDDQGTRFYLGQL